MKHHAVDNCQKGTTLFVNLFVVVTSHTTMPSANVTNDSTCSFCNLKFDSRNAIFRHLRSSERCLLQLQESLGDEGGTSTSKKFFRSDIKNAKKRRLAIQFGYFVASNQHQEYDSCNSSNQANNNNNEIAATLICQSFFEVIHKMYPSSPMVVGGSSASQLTEEEGAIAGDAKSRSSLNFTLTSATHLRHPCLAQENTCHAARDVIGVNYRGGPAPKAIHGKINFLIDEIQMLVDKKVMISQKGEMSDGSSSSSLECIKIFGVQCLDASTHFHAEMSCTQRAYQYVIPIHWIDDSIETKAWIYSRIEKQNLTVDADGQCPTTATSGSSTPLSLVRLKKILKLIESRDVTKIGTSAPSAIASAGRYGNLCKKERRPFHNFCGACSNPSLESSEERCSRSIWANPSNEHAWRRIDKFRLEGFSLNDDTPYIILEIRGDGFVIQEIRRIVATIVAVSNGWLPIEFLESATDPNITIETPIAPSQLLYLSSTRFHFLDLVLPSPLFGEADNNDRSALWLISLRQTIMQQHAHTLKIVDVRWLDALRNQVCPRILSALNSERIKLGKRLIKEQISLQDDENDADATVVEKSSFNGNAQICLPIAPEPYQKTVSLLHELCRQSKWPRTSDARSRFIRPPNHGKMTRGDNEEVSTHNPMKEVRPNIASKFRGELMQCGSFTVVNPKRFQGKVPAVNEQFSALVEALFELEEYCLSECQRDALDENYTTAVGGDTTTKTSSTHCIVNRNVAFTPHFLPGSKGRNSTIVGLGDYAGGEFIVDGKQYEIRYQPLRYDGWKQISSTKSFQGERFSLVWFTPERREEVGNERVMSFEDSHATLLVQKHNVLLPSYPHLKFRIKSTDALVINEILDSEKGCDYELSENVWSSMIANSDSRHNNAVEKSPNTGFSLKGHDVVLDIGAHIGAFSRYAIGVGCQQIIAYEPELENAKLLEDNLGGAEIGHTIQKCAVAHGGPGLCNFVNARNRTDGTLNSWRHSLEKYSIYVDRKGGGNQAQTIEQQDAVLARSQVKTIPLFGPDGALSSGITFVKMDCEGAEIDLLLSVEASNSSSWLDVTHLVLEWSLTKERRVNEFHKAVQNLESAGFDVVYEGQGSWWDTEPNCMWPYHTDLLVFARR